MPEIPYTVGAVFKVDSDWGSIVLVTDKAAIRRDPTFLYPSDVRFSETQIFFGIPENFQTVDLPFNIIGSTEPVNIITSHGDSSSSGPRSGNVTVEIFTLEPSVLVNTDFTGDGVNAKVFSQVSLYTK